MAGAGGLAVLVPSTFLSPLALVEPDFEGKDEADCAATGLLAWGAEDSFAICSSTAADNGDSIGGKRDAVFVCAGGLSICVVILPAVVVEASFFIFSPRVVSVRVFESSWLGPPLLFAVVEAAPSAD